MFRKKENEPPLKPAGAADKPVETVLKPTEPRPLQPELPRRQIDIPPAPSAAPFTASGERAGEKAGVTSGEGKRLTVGPGISLSGEITACDRVVVQGSVQVTLNETRAIEITETGRFTNGKAEVEEAEISGLYEGELTVHNRLLIRSTGQVKGTVRYGELEIERGGKLSGSVSMLESNND